jgi:hypothetical protein
MPQVVVQPVLRTGWRLELPGSKGSLRNRSSPAPTQRPIDADQRRRGVGLRLRQLIAVVQHFAFGVQHDQEIGHARVETQAHQLRYFCYAINSCLRPSLMGWRPI